MTCAPTRYAETEADLLGRAAMEALSGLDFIRGIADGTYASPPIYKTLNFRMVSAERGEVVLHGSPVFTALNPWGVIHGGWFGTLLDSCMSCAVQTHLPAGRTYTTLEYKINMIRPLHADGGEVAAIGTASHVGRRTGVAQGRIVGREDGRLYATGSTTCLVIDHAG